MIGGHWGLAPKLSSWPSPNQIEAYNLPQGVITHLFRDIAAHKPGHITRVGLGTFVDPRNGGGKLNARTTEDLVELMTLDGQEYLFYKTFPINVGIIRATTADPDGNLTMEKEALTLEALAIAMAAHNSGGIVIAQVERVAESGSLNPRQVKIPGVLVDCVVVAEARKPLADLRHPVQSRLQRRDSRAAGSLSADADERAQDHRPPRRPRTASPTASSISASACPRASPTSPMRRGSSTCMTLTAEPGVIGGVPAERHRFRRGDQYPGGDRPALPVRFLRRRRAGCRLSRPGPGRPRRAIVNVSKFGPKLAGAGGFINISQNAKKVVFVGTFTAGGLQHRGGRRQVADHPEEATARKFVEAVEHVPSAATMPTGAARPVLYVTERCVFQLAPDGLELIEIAPGIDLERDILARWISAVIREAGADGRAHLPRRAMDLREDLLAIPLDQRFTLDEAQNLFFVNFERFACAAAPTSTGSAGGRGPARRLGRHVYAIVNYDNFSIVPELLDEYSAMVRSLIDRFYTGVTRYTTTAFLRIKLGEALRNAASRRISTRARRKRSRTGAMSRADRSDAPRPEPAGNRRRPAVSLHMPGPWSAVILLTLKSTEVIGLRVAKLAGGGVDAGREAHLAVNEKVDAVVEIAATLMSGALPTDLVGRFREQVAANARRLSAESREA